MNYPQSQEFGWSEFLARFHIDLWLGLFLLGVAAVGILVVYSASGHSVAMTINQIERIGIGLAAMVI